jgi:hypothetical protein
VNRSIATAVGSLLAIVACGASTPPGSAAPRSRSVVEIPEVEPEPDESRNDEQPPPAAHREAHRDAEQGQDDVPSEVPEDMFNPWGPSSAAGGGGPDCDRAADCCAKIVQRAGPDPALLTACAGLRQAPVPTCTQMLVSFRQVAPQLGVQCN